MRANDVVDARADPRTLSVVKGDSTRRVDDSDGMERRFLELLPTVRSIVAFLARRYCLSTFDLEDFSSEVYLKLIEDDYAVLRRFRHTSSMKTYLSITIARLLIDRTNREWGRWRPSAEARRAGPVAILLEKLVMRDQYTVDEACEALITNHHVALSRHELEGLFARLPVRRPRRFEPVDAVVDAIAYASLPDDVVVLGEARAVATRVSAALADVMRALPAQDRLILRMRFEDHLTIASIAVALRIDNKRLYGRIERLLARLRIAILAQGIGVDDIAFFLARDEAD